VTSLMYEGFLQTFTWINLLACLAGTVLGMVFGALPGLTATMGIALLVPLTFGMPADSALIILTAIYGAAVFGGSIPAILLHTPGTPAGAATCIDGYQLTLKGQGGQALGISAVCSATGGMVSAFALLLIAPPLAQLSLMFGPAEYVWVAIFGLTIIASLSRGSMLKGLISGGLGLLIGTIGVDYFTGETRFTFGFSGLFDGVAIVPALIGLFSLSQALILAEERWHPQNRAILRFSWRECIPSLREYTRLLPLTLRSSGIGAFVGILPGAGGDIASWIAYSEARRYSKKRDQFGTGIVEGVAAPESANNAVTGGALIPLLTLGIPGSSAAAVLLGGLLIQGLIPGQRLFVDHGVITYAVIFSFFVANAMMLLIGLLGAGVFQRINLVPVPVLIVLIVTLSVIGSYALQNSMFDVWVLIVFGVLGYAMRKLDFMPAAMVLGMILSPILERGLRQGLDISQGDILFFFSSVISQVLIALTLLSLLLPLVLERLVLSRAPSHEPIQELD
jgi:putative tricarboxylic transport membrane protein